jgi:hypothetical protein
MRSRKPPTAVYFCRRRSSQIVGDKMTKPSTLNRSRYADTAETAAYARYSQSHLRALVRAGKFPKPVRPYGPGGKCLWDLDLIDDHIRWLAVQQGVIPAA